MTREEELQQAADNYSDIHKNDEDIDYVTTKIAPIEIVECASKKLDLSSLWHEATEEPQSNRCPILCKDTGGSCWVENMFVVLRLNTWDEYVKIEMVDKWAYIKDLLPKGDAK